MESILHQPYADQIIGKTGTLSVCSFPHGDLYFPECLKHGYVVVARRNSGQTFCARIGCRSSTGRMTLSVRFDVRPSVDLSSAA